MDFLNYGDNVRQSDIPFNELAPGCKYNIGKAWGNVIIPLKEAVLSEFLSKARDYLYNVAYQLFDGIGKRISLNLISVSQWDRVVHNDDGGVFFEIEVHAHNTKYRSFMSRNQIEEKCDEITDILLQKTMIP